MSVKLENYVSEFELIFETPTEYQLSTLIKAIEEQISSKSYKETANGTFYVKDILDLKSSYIILFGKDNPDASNHKRKKKDLTFNKIDIDEQTEILTDYIHIGISKKYSKRDTKFVHKVFMEKSSLFRVYSLKNYIDAISENSMLTSLQKRAITEFYEAISSSKRIINITEVKRDIDNPLPIDKDDNAEVINDVIVTKELRYTPSKRGGTIGIDAFNKVLSIFAKGKNSDLYVKIQDESGSTININFDKFDAQYAVKYSIPINKREDGIQKDISDAINFFITK